MARVPINVYDAPGIKDTNGTVVTMVSGDSANNHSVEFTSEGIIIVVETTGILDLVVQGVEDKVFGRVGSQSVTLLSGNRAILGPFYRDGFMQSDGTLHVDVFDNTCNLFAIRIKER